MEETVKVTTEEPTPEVNEAPKRIYNIKFSDGAMGQLWDILGDAPANKVMDLMLQIRHQFMVQKIAFDKAEAENMIEDKIEDKIEEEVIDKAEDDSSVSVEK